MEGKPPRPKRAPHSSPFPSSSSSSSLLSYTADSSANINVLDDGCLMHIFSFLSPIPDRHNTALVCHRWRYLACHPRLWLRVERSVKLFTKTGVFANLEDAILAARPGDTILIAAGGDHIACNIQIRKPLCLIGGGDHPDDTVLTCPRGADSAMEFLSTCKVANITIRAALGCCLLHRVGRLTIEGCLLQCEENPLDYLSCAIVSTANNNLRSLTPGARKKDNHRVLVVETRIEGGTKAILTKGTLALRHVRVIYAPTAVFFWFELGD